jgi:hypothetical protein
MLLRIAICRLPMLITGESVARVVTSANKKVKRRGFRPCRHTVVTSTAAR